MTASSTVTRHLVIRDGGDGTEQTVPGTQLPLEANLHKAHTQHPELLPAEDLGMGPMVVVS